jgi:hypothetical protein
MGTSNCTIAAHIEPYAWRRHLALNLYGLRAAAARPLPGGRSPLPRHAQRSETTPELVAVAPDWVAPRPPILCWPTSATTRAGFRLLREAIVVDFTELVVPIDRSGDRSGAGHDRWLPGPSS